MPYKNYLECEREKEKRFYQICTELMNNGEIIIENAMTSEWHGALKKIGIRGQSLIEGGLLSPIWKTTHKNNNGKRLIRVPKGVIVKERQTKEKSIFNFIKE